MLSVMLTFLSATGCRKDETQKHTRNSKEDTFAWSLSHLTNVSRFADSNAEKVFLVSSYDRSGGNEDWLKVDADKHERALIADLKGPGIVRRFWVTGMKSSQKLEFFFDDEKEPRISKTIRQLFNQDEIPFIAPLCDIVSKGRYCYVPLPYKESLKIYLSLRPEHGDRPYFQFTCESLPVNADIESFPEKLSSRQKDALLNVAEAWESNQSIPASATSKTEKVVSHTLQPGQNRQLFNIEEPGMISSFWIKAEPSGKVSSLTRQRLLRDLQMSFFWDGASAPSIDVPLGDFFCNSSFYREFNSWALGMRDDTFVSRLPMPFRESAKASIRNLSSFPVKITAGYELDAIKEDQQIRMLHARWNQSASKGAPHTVLSTRGKGHLAGCYLTTLGTDGTWTILEGDERMWIDGESKPSWHGTGLEDYFNGAWYYAELFDLPLHGLLQRAAMNTSQYRFHLPSPVPFDKSLEFSFEFGEANRGRGVISSVAYWYQAKPVPSQTETKLWQKRHIAPNPAEMQTAMCGILELERIGHWDEARARSAYLAEKYSGQEFGEIFGLRSAAYGLLSRQNNDALESFSSEDSSDKVKQQSQQLKWVNAAENRYLLGIQVNGNATVYLNEKKIYSGSSPRDLVTVPVELAKGRHRLVVKFIPPRWQPLLLISLFDGSRSVPLTQKDKWRYSLNEPSKWPSELQEDSPLANATRGVPQMSVFRLSPNAYVTMQTGSMIHRLDNAWHKRGEPGYLSRSFTVPLTTKDPEQVDN